MRRILGPLLFGLGAFLLVAGLLLRFYAYPRVAIAPLDQNSVTKLEAKGAEVFDSATLKPLQTDLAVSSRTVGDVKASEAAGGDVRVWVNTVSIRSSDGVVRSRSVERTPFDGVTAEAVNCCGAFDESTEGERVPAKRDGLVFKFPFNTEKKTYKLWDNTLGDTVTTKYVKESSVKGMDVWIFTAEVPRTQVGTMEVPASVVGEPGTGNVTAQSMYQNSKTYYVEPITGAVVDQQQDQTSSLAVDDEDRLITTKANIRYTPATVTDMVSDLESKVMLLGLVKTTGPLVTIILGLLLLAAGFVLGRRRQEAVGGVSEARVYEPSGR
ncbi:MAG: hypothetical protein JWR85_1201 [Marmoricola sp.]|nr:hypothetical protein [Marmoricola sp.]